MEKYEATIGLEIHAELKTASKMFCSCKNNPDEDKPNINICPICMGHPGTLPVLNKEAIKYVLKMGYAVKGDIADFTEWDRKNYFYPDIPKGYQISQYKYPLIKGGELAGVKLTRIHLEEDTAQSTHDTHKKSLINFNRSGIPLMELVTEPVIHNAETAVFFAKELQLLLRYIGAGEANMEKGEMRVEANISVSSDHKKFGTKTEIKNLNSFKALEKAIAYEISRQIGILEKGGSIEQETRGWDENKGETFSQRKKESSHDYRYFPDPDIPKLKIKEIEEFSRGKIMKELPELPWQKRERFIKDFKMTSKEATVFVEQTEVAKYFEEVIKKDSKIVKLAKDYILNVYLGLLKEGLKIDSISPKYFSVIMKMIDEKLLSSSSAKSVMELTIKYNSDPREIAEKNNLIQKSDEGEIKNIVKEIIEKNKSVVEDYKKGKTVALQFLIGQGMKMAKGSINPELLKKIIIEIIG
ncbi:MAG: Asp-tRNA(Asn)/Glu-tRNA(Gln) amidotransferase subunit GatB [Patescibacteria group bacterium]